MRILLDCAMCEGIKVKTCVYFNQVPSYTPEQQDMRTYLQSGLLHLCKCFF